MPIFFRFLHPEILGIKKQLLYYDNHEFYDLDMVMKDQLLF